MSHADCKSSSRSVGGVRTGALGGSDSYWPSQAGAGGRCSRSISSTTLPAGPAAPRVSFEAAAKSTNNSGCAAPSASVGVYRTPALDQAKAQRARCNVLLDVDVQRQRVLVVAQRVREPCR